MGIHGKHPVSTLSSVSPRCAAHRELYRACKDKSRSIAISMTDLKCIHADRPKKIRELEGVIILGPDLTHIAVSRPSKKLFSTFDFFVVLYSTVITLNPRDCRTARLNCRQTRRASATSPPVREPRDSNTASTAHRCARARVTGTCKLVAVGRSTAKATSHRCRVRAWQIC